MITRSDHRSELTGDVEVLRSADNMSVRTVASQMAVVRDALSALVPATVRISVPVTVLLEFEGTHRRVIVDTPRRVYVVGRCGPVSHAPHGEIECRSRLSGNAFSY
jgi:hypothetical protein